MKEPTEKQVKELWEWCGLKLINYSERLGEVWVDDCRNIVFLDKQLPIDLNNLFKYAVPKLPRDCVRFYPIKAGWTVMIMDGLKNYAGKGKNPALALFWAIYGIIIKVTEVE